MPDENGNSKNNVKVILITMLGTVITLCAGITLGYFLFYSPTSEDSEDLPAQVEAIEDTDPYYLELGEFVANIGSRRFLKAVISLRLSEKDARTFLEERMVEVQDIVLTTLRNQTHDQLQSPETMDSLKQELTQKISSLFPSKPDWDDPEPIKRVLFPTFILQ